MRLNAKLPEFFRGPETEDGIGQSLVTDLIWLGRFRKCRKMAVVWSAPDASDIAAWQGHRDLSRFGDFLIAVAAMNGRTWRVVERIWNGWPDPPAFAFFATERDGSLWAAADFDDWPETWAKPRGST